MEARPAGTKTVLIISDTHCGAISGLTPPNWDGVAPADKWKKVRRDLWNEFVKTVRRIQPVDVLIYNGDLIEGPSNTMKEAGMGLMTTDRIVQTSMAADIIRTVGAEKVVIIKGTAFHEGDREDWSDIVAAEVNADACSGQAWVEVNGIVFDCKHKVGGSNIPHGAFTAAARSRVWNLIANEIGTQPKADIIIRSHLHTFSFCGNSRYLAIVTPGLQGYTRYGSRMVERLVDWGMVWFAVEPGGIYRPDWQIIRPVGMKAKVVKV